jgi:hypothetical protein
MEKKPVIGNISIILCGCRPPARCTRGVDVLRKRAKMAAGARLNKKAAYLAAGQERMNLIKGSR